MSNTVKARQSIEQSFVVQKRRRLRAIIYCRVSTDKQEQDGESLDYQEQKCRQYCKLHDSEIVTVLKEVKSGFIHYSLREKLTAARQMVRDGLADLIVVWDLRRFSRNFVHSAMIFQEIEEAGGAVISVSENIDNSPTGLLIRAILAWSAESERHKYVEYANRHWQARLEQKLPMSSGVPPYGWKWANAEKTAYEIDLEKAGVRYALFHMFVELEMSLRAIAHKLTEDRIPAPGRPRRFVRSQQQIGRVSQEEDQERSWNAPTVRRMLKDPAVIGTLVICKTRTVLLPDGKRTQQPHPQRTEIPGGIPALLRNHKDIMLYQRAQAKLATNQRTLSKMPQDPEDFLLRGHVHCGGCGYKMRPCTDKRGQPGKNTYYQCNGRGNKHAACPNSQFIRTSPLTEIVWAECCLLFERLEEVKERIEREMEHELAALLENTTGQEQAMKKEAELETARAEQKKHEPESYLYGLIGQDIAKKEAELARFQEELGSVGDMSHALAVYQERLVVFLDFLTEMRGKYEQASFQEKRNALDILGVQVIIHDSSPAYERQDILADTWYTAKEAAALWGGNRRSLSAHIQNGSLSAEMRERRWYVKGADLLAFLQQGYEPGNVERYVRSRIDITYSPRFLTLANKALTQATGVAQSLGQFYDGTLQRKSAFQPLSQQFSF